MFAPFIFIEDPTDVNGQHGFVPDSLGIKGSITGGGAGSNNSSTLLTSKPKIDPYFIISQVRLSSPVSSHLTNFKFFQELTWPIACTCRSVHSGGFSIQFHWNSGQLGPSTAQACVYVEYTAGDCVYWYRACEDWGQQVGTFVSQG